jgi:hypothetical protein
VTVPFCYGAIEMLDEMQCATTKMNALKQQKRLRNISPDVFNDHLSHRVTAGIGDAEHKY